MTESPVKEMEVPEVLARWEKIPKNVLVFDRPLVFTQVSRATGQHVVSSRTGQTVRREGYLPLDFEICEKHHIPLFVDPERRVPTRGFGIVQEIDFMKNGAHRIFTPEGVAEIQLPAFCATVEQGAPVDGQAAARAKVATRMALQVWEMVKVLGGKGWVWGRRGRS